MLLHAYPGAIALNHQAQPATDVGDCSAPELPEKPTSPNLVSELPLADEQRSLTALQTCQLVLIEAYCAFATKGTFCLDYEAPPAGMPPLHPIQDPSGALFVALLMVHRHQPNAGVFASPDAEGRLSKRVRRELCAILLVCQKMCMQGPDISCYMRHMTRHFLYQHEWPRWEADWQKECSHIERLEMQVVRQPLLSMVTTTAMCQVENEIERLLMLKKLSLSTCAVLRGGAFFFLGSCMLELDSHFDVVAESVGPNGIGEGCVSLMLTLLHTSGMAPGGRGLQTDEVLYRAPYGAQADVAAQAMLRAALGPHAQQLRIGPYRPPMEGQQSPPVQRLVSPENLRKGANVLLECM